MSDHIFSPSSFLSCAGYLWKQSALRFRCWGWSVDQQCQTVNMVITSARSGHSYGRHVQLGQTCYPGISKCVLLRIGLLSSRTTGYVIASKLRKLLNNSIGIGGTCLAGLGNVTHKPVLQTWEMKAYQQSGQSWLWNKEWDRIRIYAVKHSLVQNITRRSVLVPVCPVKCHVCARSHVTCPMPLSRSPLSVWIPRVPNVHW